MGTPPAEGNAIKDFQRSHVLPDSHAQNISVRVPDIGNVVCLPHDENGQKFPAWYMRITGLRAERNGDLDDMESDYWDDLKYAVDFNLGCVCTCISDSASKDECECGYESEEVSSFSAGNIEEEKNWKNKKRKKIDDDRDIDEEDESESDFDQVLCDFYGLRYDPAKFKEDMEKLEKRIRTIGGSAAFALMLTA
ncbi:hypothetical protein SCAR479_02361 [Seiridium cardinale]|uniref:Uncharacterized protein n=1 Tax=Seiridium cardinale TaxID=138064 RepID=A0ABR2X674_9PEZI